MVPEPADHFANARAVARALRFGVSRQSHIEALIIALSNRGFESSDARVTLFLAPLLNIPQARSDALLPPGITTEPPPNGSGGPLPETPKKRRWTAKELTWASGVLAALLLIAVVVAILWPLHSPTFENFPNLPGKKWTSVDPPPPPPPPPVDPAWLYPINVTVLGYLFLLAALTAITVVAWPYVRRWWERRRMHQFRRDPLPDRSKLIKVATRLARARLFSDPALTIALRKLRRHRAAPSTRIDVRRSIRATINNGKIPSLRFARRRLSPDYVFLSERERPHDHLAEVATAWRERLNEAKIACEHYEFFGDPNTLRQTTDSDGRDTGSSVGRERLDGVLDRHDGAELIVMLESFDALASAEGDPQWLARAARRANPHLMNPREPRFWSQLETRLDDLGMPAFPANVAGTLELADRIDRTIDDADADDAPPRAPGQADLAAFFATHRALVLSPDRPTDVQVATILDTLQRWLDAEAFDWLRALAIFPIINGGFTFFAGSVLKENTIVTHDRYLTLARLPWLRAAYMPDWFRLALIETLSLTALERARATAAAFLQPPTDVGEREEQLIELRRHAEKRATHKRLAEWLESGSNPALNDRLLIEVLKGAAPDKLGVMIDRDIAEDEHTDRRRETMLAIAVNAISMIGLLVLQPPSWQHDEVLSIGKSTDPVEQQDSTPSLTPNTQPTPKAERSPTPTPKPTPTASPTPTPTASPTPTPTASPTPTPTASPTPTPTASPTDSPTASPTDSPTASPTDSPTSVQAPVANTQTTQIPTTAPTPNAIKGTTALIYVQYALPDQAETAAIAQRSLDGLNVAGVTFSIGQVENRGAASLYDTQLRCFEDSGCAVGAQLQPYLRKLNISARLVRSRPTDVQQQNSQSNILELWLGSGPTQTLPPQLNNQQTLKCRLEAPFIVYFDWDRSDITAEAASILDTIVANYGCKARVNLAGYTDRSGAAEYNVFLSQNRANSVRAYLVSNGISRSVIATQAFGESRPRVPTADGVREPANRRVEITFGLSSVRQ